MSAVSEADGPTTDFTKFYAPLAVLVPVWSFLPLYDKVTDRAQGFSSGVYGTLWDMAGQFDGTFGVLGLVTAAAMTILLVLAAKGSTHVVVPGLVAALGALMVLGIAVKPGELVPPAMADTGRAAMALLVVAIAVAIWHIVTLIVAGRPARAGAPDTRQG